MAAQITNYQCPACTGPLYFSSEIGKLACDYCGSSFTVEEVEAFYAEKNEQAAAAFEKEEQDAQAQEPAAVSAPGNDQAPESAGVDPPETNWDTSGLSDDWGAEAANMRAYSCPSCGAELICDATTAATSCPYCGNNSIVPGQFAGSLKPDRILPFKLNKEAAIAALKQHYKGKWLLPDAFSGENHLQKIQGVYVPFWLYDAKVDAECQFQGIIRTVSRHGDTETTATSYYNIIRKGTVEFNGVPVDGSTKTDDSYMDSLEPYDYSELKPFSLSYLPGYLADRYDQGADLCAKRADERCKRSAIASMRADVTGYQSISDTGQVTRLDRGKVHYALLPVWILYTKWQNQDYLFMMNGQTGKFVGNLPVDQKKATRLTVILTVALSLFFLVTNVGSCAADILLSFVAGG